jgi:hypothetical protein
MGAHGVGSIVVINLNNHTKETVYLQNSIGGNYHRVGTRKNQRVVTIDERTKAKKTSDFDHRFDYLIIPKLND